MQHAVQTAHLAFCKDPGGCSETYYLPLEKLERLISFLKRKLGRGLYSEFAAALKRWKAKNNCEGPLTKKQMEALVVEFVRDELFNDLEKCLELPTPMPYTFVLLQTLKHKFSVPEIPSTLQDTLRSNGWQQLPESDTAATERDAPAAAELEFVMHALAAGMQPKLFKEADEGRLLVIAPVLRDVLPFITGFDLQKLTHDPSLKQRMSAFFRAALSLYFYDGFWAKVVQELAVLSNDPVLQLMPIHLGAKVGSYVASLFGKNEVKAINQLMTAWDLTALPDRCAAKATTVLNGAALLDEELCHNILGKKKLSLDARASYGSAVPMAPAPMPRASGGAQLQRAFAGMRFSAGAPAQCPPRAPRCSGGALQPRASAGAAVKSVLGTSYMLC